MLKSRTILLLYTPKSPGTYVDANTVGHGVGSFLVSASVPVPEGFSLGIEYLAKTQFIDALNLCREFCARVDSGLALT
jgi:hypothetical protein